MASFYFYNSACFFSFFIVRVCVCFCVVCESVYMCECVCVCARLFCVDKILIFVQRLIRRPTDPDQPQIQQLT